MHRSGDEPLQYVEAQSASAPRTATNAPILDQSARTAWYKEGASSRKPLWVPGKQFLIKQREDNLLLKKES